MGDTTSVKQIYGVLVSVEDSENDRWRQHDFLASASGTEYFYVSYTHGTGGADDEINFWFGSSLQGENFRAVIFYDDGT